MVLSGIQALRDEERRLRNWWRIRRQAGGCAVRLREIELSAGRIIDVDHNVRFVEEQR